MHLRLAIFVSTSAAAALVIALVPSSAHAQVASATLPPELRDVGVDEHLGSVVPTDGVFRDHTGREVHLAQYFDGRRPVVLNLAYYRCPMLCSMVTNALINGLRSTGWTVGNEFDVITLSIDPREGPAEATQKRTRVLEQYRRDPAEHGWHFLTGEQAEIDRVARAVGFGYHYDVRQNQYAHPAVVFLLTPNAHVARYLYGIEFNQNDVRIGLLEASQGHSISTTERVLLYCFHYDPQGRRYVIVAMHVMQVGGALSILVLGGFLALLWSRERIKRNRENEFTHRETSPPATATDARS